MGMTLKKMVLFRGGVGVVGGGGYRFFGTAEGSG